MVKKIEDSEARQMMMFSALMNQMQDLRMSNSSISSMTDRKVTPEVTEKGQYRTPGGPLGRTGEDKPDQAQESASNPQTSQIDVGEPNGRSHGNPGGQGPKSVR